MAAENHDISGTSHSDSYHQLQEGFRTRMESLILGSDAESIEFQVE